jgi:predicted GH43/DUF377 family glycosyl hydrolase
VATTPDLRLEQLPVTLTPDPGRVILRPFAPAPEPRAHHPVDLPRVSRIVARVLALSEDSCAELTGALRADFGGRHRDLTERLLARYESIAAFEPAQPADRPLSEARRLLIGAYFCHEYAFEAAALFNPSIVPHPDQAGVADGDLRFVMSLRATGEGHISSLAFRSGLLTAGHELRLDEPPAYATLPRRIERIEAHGAPGIVAVFDPPGPLNERVIFPVLPTQANGLEDARFTLFEDGAERSWIATYVAYDGRQVRPELLITADFVRFSFLPLRGRAVRNKGFALFPRRIGGRYAMLSRQDGENVLLMTSDELLRWDEAAVIYRPREPWEFVQLGNCGSPILTEAGWLVLSHGVGAMRRYCLGAFLLDRDDPSRVIGRLREPLVAPPPDQRGGYVPNVVYTCGALLHGDHLLLPYGVADNCIAFATLPLAALLSALQAS